MNIIYKIAEIDDANQLTEIESNIFSFPHSLDQFRFELSSEHYLYYIALENDKIVGYVGLQYVLDEGYITNIAVLDSYRGNGIAENLMKLVIEKSKYFRLSFISLEVRKSNINAISLYKKLNFNIVSTLPSYYKKPIEDGLIMTLEY